ncbi:MAG: S8 family peptidase [candidate division WOR-3 bacterium]|nr:S8 family peptidase [candidate division WOR-3 bacterium]
MNFTVLMLSVKNDYEILKVWTYQVEPYFLRLNGGIVLTKSYILNIASAYYPGYLLKEEALKNRKFQPVLRGKYFKSSFKYDYGKSREHLEFHNIIKVHEQGIIGLDVKLAILDTGFDSTNPTISHLWRDRRIIKSWDFNSGDSMFLFNVKNSNLVKLPIPSNQIIYISDYDFLDSLFVISLSFENELTNNPKWRIYLSNIKNGEVSEISSISSRFLLEPKIRRKVDSIVVFYKSWINGKNYALSYINLSSGDTNTLTIDEIIQYDILVNDSIYFAYGNSSSIKIYDNTLFFGKFGGIHYFSKDSMVVSLNDSIFLIYKENGSWYKVFRFIGRYPSYCNGKISYVRNDSVFLDNDFILYEIFSDRPDCKNLKVLAQFKDGFFYNGNFYNFDFARVLRIYNDTLIAIVRRGDSNVYPEYPNLGGQYHGTSMLSVIAGISEGSLIGVSPGVKLILAKTEKTITTDSNYFESIVEEDFWVNAAEWAVRNGARIISSSLGYIDWYSKKDLDGKTAISSKFASKVINYNALIITAMGNVQRNTLPNSPDTSLFAPADADSIIAVGGINYDLTPSKNSSFGPTSDGRIKPDISALFGPYYISNYNGFHYAYGTSLSTAMVSGICALALQAHTNWSARKLRDVILKTAKEIPNYSKPNNFVGYGLIDAYKLVNYEPIKSPISIRIYPNPAREFLKIKIDGYIDNIAKLRIMTLSGKIVFERDIELKGFEIKIDIKDWQSGLYIVSVILENQVINGKFVKI